MLEILGVIGLCKMIGGVLERKGRRSGWFKFFVVIAWFGGEFAGGFIGAVAAAVMNPGKEPSLLPIYLAALVCAGLGVGVVFLVASMLPDLRPMQAAMQPAGGAVHRRTRASRRRQSLSGAELSRSAVTGGFACSSAFLSRHAETRRGGATALRGSAVRYASRPLASGAARRNKR